MIDKYLKMVRLYSPETIESFFGRVHQPLTSPIGVDLGEGVSLIYVNDEVTETKSTKGFGFLYKDGKRILDSYVRLGGISGKFKEGYANVIVYPKLRDEKGATGHHTIVDTNGRIALQADSQLFDYPYHVGGNIGVQKNTFYNLLTGDVIVVGFKDYFKSKDFVFCEVSYSKNQPNGIYKIDKFTCEYEFFEQ